VNIRSVLHILGWLALLTGLLLLIPFGIALYCSDSFDTECTAFLVSIVIAVVIGMALKMRYSFDADNFSISEGFASVSLGWLAVVIIGAFPFYLSGVCSGWVDAFFETMSGFTTTGATIFSGEEIEALPAGILFWRSFTHWLGGMGIVALSIAVLPLLGGGGNMLFRAEVPGPVQDKLAPRIAQTAKILWYIYTALTLIEVLLLWIFEMDLFDAFCHAFGTMATGGFSTKGNSIAAYGPSIQWIIIVFMFLAGVNFSLYFHLIKGRFEPIFKNSELRLYVGLFLVAVIALTLFLHFSSSSSFSVSPEDPAFDRKVECYSSSAEKSFRDSVFQSISILTTTGYCTADFDVWPHFCRFLLIALMVCGACAGSTGGGMKVIRLFIAAKASVREIRRIIRPRTVFNVSVQGNAIPSEVINNTVGFFILYFIIWGVCTVIMHLFGLDLETAFSSVLACISNIGPGLGGVGAEQNFANIPAMGKLLLTFCMLLGRLELYSVLILFIPLTWKR